MKIIVDAFGGDHAPLEIIKGASMAVSELDVDIILTGKESIIKEVAQKENISLNRIEIANADEIITMEDESTSVLRAKKNSSMGVGFDLLSKGQGDAFVSAGNSGALVVGSSMIVKRIKGIKRAAFAPVMPTLKGCTMLIDCGANVECRPDMLLQFGLMGSIYMEKVMNIKNPRVGLLNVGTEEHKGTKLHTEAYELLKESNINFIGNVEGRDLSYGGCDVLVADGFSGNIILKTYEGTSLALFDKMKEVFSKNAKTKIAAALVMNDLRAMKKEFDYNEYGGSPIMGISKPVFKAHGSSKAKTIKNAIRLTKGYIESNVTNEILQNIQLMKNDKD